MFAPGLGLPAATHFSVFRATRASWLGLLKRTHLSMRRFSSRAQPAVNYAVTKPSPQRTNSGGSGGTGRSRTPRRQHLIDNHHVIPKHDSRRSPPTLPCVAKPVKMHLAVRLKMTGHRIRPPPTFKRDRQLIATFSEPRADVEVFAADDGTPRVAGSGRVGTAPWSASSASDLWSSWLTIQRMGCRA